MVLEYTRNEKGEFVCPTCKVIKQKQNTMHYHMKRHEGNLPFECSHCKKQFQFQQTLDLHLQAKHRDEVPKKAMLKCPVDGCPFESLTEGNRRIHFLRKHCVEEVTKILTRKDTTYSCTSCKLTFQSSTAFHYHSASCVSLDTAKQNYMNLIY